MSGEENKEKTEDKKEIEEEEREKMLNEENKKQQQLQPEEPADAQGQGAEETKVATGEVERKRKALEEATRKDDKGRIPIGGIRMPGFLRSRSRDKTKSEPDPEEGVDLLEEPGAGSGAGVQGDKPAEAEQTGTARRSLRLPALPKMQLPSMPPMSSIKFANPFAKKKKEKDVEAGVVSQPAGDSQNPQSDDAPPQEIGGDKEQASEKEKEANKDEDDGMETVQLDEKGDAEKAAATEAGAEKEARPLWERIRTFKHKFVAGGVLVLILLLIIIIAVAASGPRRDFARGPIPDGRFAIATTQCGPIQGLLEHGAYTFRGIPYARPPVGELRWKPAQALDSLEHCWNGTLKTHNASAYCWQIFPDDQSMNGAEDCLTLDVYTPQVSYENLLPVVVVVGSTHMTGGSTTPLLQPTAKLARAKEVVFVRPNFRMGVLGFLSTSALSRSVYPQTSGNYGLSDIKLALEWVKRNIAAFGGNPDEVTVLGYRAGATLVTALTATPNAKALMKRVWVTSGSADFPGHSLSESESDAAPFLANIHCNENVTSSGSGVTVDCLRSMEAEDLLDAMPADWRPTTPSLPSPPGPSGMPTPHQWLVLDGDLLRAHPSEVWEKWEREGSPIKFVIGATAHSDATLELYRNVSDGDKAAIESQIRGSALGQMGLAEAALEHYNASWPGLAALVSDLRTVCPLNALALKMPTTAYFYVATFPISVTKSESELEYQPLAELGVDVAAIMGRVEGATPEERRYITAMQQLFYQFVRGGEPHHGSEPYSGRVLVIDQDTLPKTEYPNCNYWIHNDAVPRYGHRN